MRNHVIAAALLSAASGMPAQAATQSNLYLRVGPGIHATIITPEMHLSCSDDANCRFEVPPNTTFDVVAAGATGRPLNWTGCSAKVSANRCRVEMRRATALITVR